MASIVPHQSRIKLLLRHISFAFHIAVDIKRPPFFIKESMHHIALTT